MVQIKRIRRRLSLFTARGEDAAPYAAAPRFPAPAERRSQFFRAGIRSIFRCEYCLFILLSAVINSLARPVINIALQALRLPYPSPPSIIIYVRCELSGFTCAEDDLRRDGAAAHDRQGLRRSPVRCNTQTAAREFGVTEQIGLQSFFLLDGHVLYFPISVLVPQRDY